MLREIKEQNQQIIFGLVTLAVQRLFLIILSPLQPPDGWIRSEMKVGAPKMAFILRRRFQQTPHGYMLRLLLLPPLAPRILSPFSPSAGTASIFT